MNTYFLSHTVFRDLSRSIEHFVKMSCWRREVDGIDAVHPIERDNLACICHITTTLPCRTVLTYDADK